MSKRLCILTCISNAKGFGPGHTAVVIGDTVYSFEAMGDWGYNNSGWVVMDAQKYIDNNSARPVVLQYLKEIVDRGKVEAWILASIASDTDYGSSGVCSSLASSAIEAGYNGSFNPDGVDTPYRVFHLAVKKGIVDSTTFTWPGRSSLWDNVRNRIEAKVKADYPSLVPLM